MKLRAHRGLPVFDHHARILKKLSAQLVNLIEEAEVYYILFNNISPDLTPEPEFYTPTPSLEPEENNPIDFNLPRNVLTQTTSSPNVAALNSSTISTAPVVATLNSPTASTAPVMTTQIDPALLAAIIGAMQTAGLGTTAPAPQPKATKMKIREPEVYDGKNQGGDAERWLLSCENCCFE
ncbi:hypothetical protein M407DRAFT_31134 [Tulasnella calospora MUT 4182]|uniref:Uncharacterized protein n=1 Tax=Tulasnella calospora MUT 4182 TaxID=1051891 RepID=A0A0C3PW43_9AGAM|nr:hypothetical protein M407DRAFT_31134 [Tulasnella calospora MUT 4182]